MARHDEGIDAGVPARRQRQPRAVRLAISERELCIWLGQPSPGHVLEYHRGFLALDTMPHSGRLSDGDRAELVRVARRARWAAEKGFAHLVQRRHGPDDYAYLLMARCHLPSARILNLAPASSAEGDER